jgi:hypothetical protein
VSSTISRTPSVRTHTSAGPRPIDHRKDERVPGDCSVGAAEFAGAEGVPVEAMRRVRSLRPPGQEANRGACRGDDEPTSAELGHVVAEDLVESLVCVAVERMLGVADLDGAVVAVDRAR